jgi:hypothetical protein
MQDYEDAESEEKFLYFHKALAEDMRNRQVLSPAEALNPITVGAWHMDNCSTSVPLPSGLCDILPDHEGPSIISAVGLGHKRSIKPDLFYDGGRTLVRIIPNGSCCALYPLTMPSKYVGQKVAATSDTGELNKTTNTCGTSNAAALITRRAIQIIEMLDSLEEEYEESSISFSHRAVLVKALLAHGCKWNIESSALLDDLIEPINRKKHQQRRTNIARLNGFGRPDIERVLACTSQRATMIGQGTLSVDKENCFEIPLPDALSGKREIRRLTVTVAWMSPTNPRDLEYRQAVLDADIDFKECGTGRLAASQAPGNTIKRGTLLHNVYEGSSAMNFENDLTLRIACREQAGKLDDDVVYAVAVSFEVAEDSEVLVYEEIRDKLPIRLREPVAV